MSTQTLPHNNGTDVARLLADDEHFLWHSWSPSGTAGRGGMVVTGGRGCEVTTADGRTFLDARAGMFNATLGYGRTDVAEAMHAQALQLATYTLTQAATVPAIELARRIAGLTGEAELSRTFFCHSGSEANETAVKVARQFHALRGEAGRRTILTLADGYHGSTLATAAMSQIPAARAGNHPLPAGFVHAPAPRCAECAARRPHRTCTPPGPEAIEQALLAAGPETVAAIVLEPVLGVAGVWPLPAGYLRRVRELCDEYGVLLVLDEVMTGIGRTGTWFGYQHHGISPDIVTLCKGLGAAYATVSSVTVRQSVYEAFAADPLMGGLRHGFTTGGHATACAGALAVLDAVEREGLVAGAARTGAQLLQRLAKLRSLPAVHDVRGAGLLLAVEFDTVEQAALVDEAMADDGVLARLQGAAVTLAPPLVLTDEQAERIADCLERAALALDGNR
ncbi:aspartate aminotransferase family protein [Kitasatospora indigofera]|uniref:Aspartate aminotransferase family protein n=1 Tax=Kitasatospora indigofera TaxID=67307 RepID=A0A919L0M0_9ACTN|nr:aminotransferase class III-fold pyridoxal phosphate-dependent enzyme [Kitasatospora indigofera]GHH80470.1 aspartate aminotransferase family protein [Kitasatospora indigofera]